MSKRITRREFVHQTAKAGVGLSALSLGLGSKLGFSSILSGEPDTYDYIVVGSGAGGGPVACNLAKAGYRVLLLEAGTNYQSRNYDVPAFDAKSTEDPNMSWAFYVEHYSDPAKQMRDPKRVPGKGVLYPRAGTLGGCTAHNDMVTLYPENSDWDNIAKLVGDTSWESSTMRNYFERVERCNYVKQTAGNPSRHGYDGWLPTDLPNRALALKDPKLLELVIGSSLGRGLINNDPNDWRYVSDMKAGAFVLPQSTLNGKRRGAREHILETMAAYPDKLILKTNCLATKLLFDDVDRTRIVGIEYCEGSSLYRADPRATDQSAAAGVRRQAMVSGEVILSGGVYNSPQLLMLSGIGAASDLRALGIDVRIDLPGVGKNLQDRYEASVASETKSDFKLLENCTFGEDGDPCLVDYDKNPGASPYGTNGLFLTFLIKSTPDKPTPDIGIFGVLGDFQGYYPGWSKDALSRNKFTWTILKSHTLNTAGTVKLKSADPFDTPNICFNYFTDGNDGSGQDLEDTLTAMKYARNVNNSLFDKLIEKGEIGPGPNVKTDDELRQFIQDEAWGHHASCSNRIGPVGDPLAVVDSNFKVQGAKGLRIVDASVFPRIPGIFIVASVYMIAEKASDVILADAARSRNS